MAKKALRRLVAAIAVACVVLAVNAVRAGTWFNDTVLTVWVFDVGQGDAVFIDAPRMQILVDGGPGSAVLEKLATVLPPWDRSIDMLVATHPHADHVEGLNAVLQQYDVDTVLTSGVSYGEAPAVALEQLAEGKIVHAGRGMSWDLGDGARLDAVWPAAPLAHIPLDNPHDANVVLLLTYGDTTMLLTGDAEQETETTWATTLPHVDVLKVGHHGSDTSTGIVLTNLTTPDVAIISVGADNTYGHPSALVVDRALRAGAHVFRTDRDHDIRVWSDGGEPVTTSVPL